MPSHAPATRKPCRPASMLLAALAVLVPLRAAQGQGSGAAGVAPPAAAPTTPAEIQPGHPAPPPSSSSSQGSSSQGGPQSAVPAPLPPGSRADTPNGSARNGVIAPPGTPGGNSQVNPK